MLLLSTGRILKCPCHHLNPAWSPSVSESDTSVRFKWEPCCLPMKMTGKSIYGEIVVRSFVRRFLLHNLSAREGGFELIAD
jgi:hypothetical protein